MIKNGFCLGFCSAALAVLLVAAPFAWAGSTELRKIDLAVSPTGARLTIDLSGPAQQKLFCLAGPDRAVLDLRHTRLAAGIHLPAAEGLIEDIHTGAQAGGALRIVIRLRSAVRAHSEWGEPDRSGHRMLLITLGEMSARSEPEPEAHVNAPKMVRAQHAPQDSDRDVVVAVDAGHGGQDPGAIGRGGTREKDVTLAIARALAERINGEPGMRAVLTRDRDEFLVLRDRIRRARAVNADMFISVHADSIADRTISGASVYVLSEKGASNEAARWLAERENAADLLGGVKLDDKDDTLASVLLDLSQTASISASMTAAERVLGFLDGVGQVRKSRVQQAGFVVLKSPDIPSMLIETAYISNPSEELRLRTARQQGKLAEAIFEGVRAYFADNPPAGTRFAQGRHSTVAAVLASPAAPR
jgi:N-acetylmuramoyl-L-alanine amidase